MSHLRNTYARLPVAFSHGEGSWLTDTEGKVYLDALSGIAVSTLGHNHPQLVAAITAQAGGRGPVGGPGGRTGGVTSPGFLPTPP